jgi:hypothetical protein
LTDARKTTLTRVFGSIQYFDPTDTPWYNENPRGRIELPSSEQFNLTLEKRDTLAWSRFVSYQATPIDTTKAVLPPDLLALTERLAEHTHDTWAQRRLADGWTYGPSRDDAHKRHPGLVPYAELSDAEKQYDRATALQTLKAIVALGYRIARDDGPAA